MRSVPIQPTWSPYVNDDSPRLQAASALQYEMAAADALLRYRTLANFFVALKSCPLVILAGPSGSGKLALARLTAHLLAGDERQSAMVGHARWAAGSSNSSMLVEAQARLNRRLYLRPVICYSGYRDSTRLRTTADEFYSSCPN
jgi:ABC-type glutathione transport system ATPase component